VLAYVFWHQPAEGVDIETYEVRLRAFHAALAVPSASFRLKALPWRHEPGYEDWYLVDEWAALGALNDRAPGPAHDSAATASAHGWGGVYRLVRGPADPPAAARWLAKPRGEPYDRFLAGLDAEAVWQRQMVLGPAPELCLGGGEPHGRVRVA
jgi:hypothetical protein